MSVTETCDYCGRTIEHDQRRMRLRVRGKATDIGSRDFAYADYELGAYHSDPDDCGGERSCWGRMSDAFYLAEAAGGSIEKIPVATPQKIGQLRRKHRKPDEAA